MYAPRLRRECDFLDIFRENLAHLLQNRQKTVNFFVHTTDISFLFDELGIEQRLQLGQLFATSHNVLKKNRLKYPLINKELSSYTQRRKSIHDSSKKRRLSIVRHNHVHRQIMHRLAKDNSAHIDAMKPGAARVSLVLPVRKDPTRSPSCRRIGYYSRTYCPTSAKTRLLLLLAVLSLVFLSHVQIDETVAEVGADAFVGGRHRCRHDAELNLHSLQDRLDCLQENALRERRRRTGRNFAARGGGDMQTRNCRNDGTILSRRLTQYCTSSNVRNRKRAPCRVPSSVRRPFRSSER